MTIIRRRVFYAKVGMAGPLVEHVREYGKLAAQHGRARKERILTDYQSGRTDRVVWEEEREDGGERPSRNRSEDDAFRTAATSWEHKMNEMIHYAEVENWTVQ